MYRHFVERQLTVDSELVGRSHPSTGVQQTITKLEERGSNCAQDRVVVDMVGAKIKCRAIPGRTFSAEGPSRTVC